MLLNCARNARCVNGSLLRQLAVFTVHEETTDRVRWRRLASSTAAQHVPSSSNEKALPPGFMRMSDILDDVFAPLISSSTFAASPAAPTRDVIEKEKKATEKFKELTKRLRNYRLPIFNNDGEAIFEKSMVKANAALLDGVKPLILPLLPHVNAAARFRMLDVMAARNIRDEELLNALYDSIIAHGGKYPVTALSYLAEKYAKLGVHHVEVLDHLIAGLLYVMQDKSTDSLEIVKTMVSLAKIRVGNAQLWMKFGKWAQNHFSDLPFLNQLDLLNAFAMISAPLLMDKWPYVTKAFLESNPDPNFMLTQTYNSVVAGVIDQKLVAQLLQPAKVKKVVKKHESATTMFNVLRLWHVSASAYFLAETEETKYIDKCALFNKFVKAKKEREKLLWQVKYSRDMSSVERFRSLLYHVAPLGTYSTVPHIHPERGVCVEANIAVCDGRLVSLAKSVDLKKAGKKVSVVSVLYFMRKHTTLPENTGNHDLLYRLDGKSNLSLRLMMAPERTGSLPKTHPVVFTEHDFDLIQDDECRRDFIRGRIEGLSERFHKLNWPTARKEEINRRSMVS